MADFIEVARVDRIPPGSGARFIAADKESRSSTWTEPSVPSPTPVLTPAVRSEWESSTARS